MQLTRIGRPRSRAVAGLAALATVVGLITAVHPAAAKPPPNPSDGQISQAQNSKAALADRIGNLQAKYTQLTVQYHQLQGAQELAEQKAALAEQKLEAARTRAKSTKQAAAAAQVQVDGAEQRFIEYAQASYMSGDVEGMTGTLLTADNPNTLLQQSALQGYQASHQLSAISDLQSATVAKSNADAAARQAVAEQATATTAAKQAEQDAAAATAAAKAQQVSVSQTLTATNAALAAAQLQLHTLLGQRATYIKWHQHQVALAKARALAAKLARERAARLAAERAQRNQNNNGGSGGSSVGAPSSGTWTAAKGQAAARRAQDEEGIMYAWAGGNAYGPTRGVCAGDGAWNDCNVTGFDCSGLAMFAWGPGLPMAHYAASQYNQAGSQHPTPGNFLPGDLLFWSSDGTVAGIHHVAVYIGGGMVVQAPESGEVIQETPWDQVSWGYYGATRPLT